ncbi:MAG: glycoside hydrolase family 38 C-terminal domain-containing protein [Eubacteriales bacterium]
MLFIEERIGKLVEELKELRYKEMIEVKEYQYFKTDEKYRNVCECNTNKWKPINNNELWGGNNEYYWFETEIVIPEIYDGECVVYELKTGQEGEWDATNPQFTIYVNDIRVQGLDVNHREVILTQKARKGDKFTILLSAFSGTQNYRLYLESCIKVLDDKTEKYYYDISVPYQVAQLLCNTDHAYITIMKSLNESLNCLDLRKVYSKMYYDSLKEAQLYIKEEFYDIHCGKSNEIIYCIGHTHIDIAWLWTLKVTEDKAVRSFSTVLELMNQYPEYQFMSSQPQLYKYVKKNAPDVYEKMKEKVKENRWQPEGGMFVEADCNLSSGESLIRQFMYGIQFFQKEFGVDNKILWLPDVFGYSAALPQIMDKCNIRYFMTTKISWNEMNKLPFDTFMWEGIDGTKILTHFSPARDYKKAIEIGSTETEHFTTYNAYINPSQMKGAWERYSQKELNNEVMISFGYGDGGGGPTKDMLENQRRMEKGIPGCPMTKMSNPREFFEVLENNVKGSKYLPEWKGELYLEYHRGTYTSMARNKKSNRFSEFMNQNLECFAVMGYIWNNEVYPKKEIYEIWEIILKNQFHDILPGSSIKEVYDDSKIEYETIKTIGSDLIAKKLNVLTTQISANNGAVVVFNPNGLEIDGVVNIDLENIGKEYTNIICDDKIYPLQKLNNNAYLFYASSVPSKGYKTYEVSNESVVFKPISITTTYLENDYVLVKIDENGQMDSIFDKINRREVLKYNQKGNVLMTFEDKPHNYDAWDLNNYYTEKCWEISEVTSMEVVEEGPVRATLKISRQYLDSTIEQYISIGYSSAEILIRNEIEWKEKQVFMKAVFPIDVHTDEATFDIQYGNVTRKTHNNTSWDQARFEVCMHKWIDVSEDDFGVSITNDCKYGCSVKNGVVGMSLIKSGIYPNPEADQEHHSFQFAIYPHKGNWKTANTVAKAYEINNPLKAIVKNNEGGSLDKEKSFVSSNVENVIIEVLKQAENSTNIIVRAYEYYNRRTNVTLKFKNTLKSVFICNMLEENQEEIKIEEESNQVIVPFNPYEIISLKIEFDI